MKVTYCLTFEFESYNEEFNQKKGKNKIKVA